MSEINARDLQCENCRKFSHCNNNELVCISKFKQLKAENEELRARNSRGMLAFLEEDFKKEQKIKEYKQCLDYIKDVVENHIMQDASEWLTLSPDVVEDYVLANCKQILDKIKEVKGNE